VIQKTLAYIVVAAAVLFLAGSAQAGGGSGFAVGFVDDAPKGDGWASIGPGVELGANAFVVSLQWSPGEAALTDADANGLRTAVGGANGTRMFVTIWAGGSTAPRDATARDLYCSYARDALSREPAINDVVIWNEPNQTLFWSPQFNPDGTSAAPAAYEALLARCWDVLHAFRPSVDVVGLALASEGNDNPGAASNASHSPGNFIRKLGDAYRASGRTLPIMDSVSHHPYGETSKERPWLQHIGSKTIAEGDWNKLMSNLATAFNGTAQPIPGQCAGGRCISIYYLESGFQTQIDPTKATLYSGTETDLSVLPNYAGGEPAWAGSPATSPAPDQATQVGDAVRLAACQPNVAGIMNFLLFDESRLAGWQSGAHWADRTPKDSAPFFRSAFTEAASGSVDCVSLKGDQPSGDYAPPSAVTDLVGVGRANPLRVELTWGASGDDAGPVLGYRVYRNGGYYAWTAGPSYTDTKVSGTTYSYTVYAQDAAGNLSAVSNKVTVSVDATPPNAPTSLVAQPLHNPGRVVLSWIAATDNIGVAGYHVYRNGALLGDSTSTTFTDASATGPASYSYSVVAYDAAGNTGPAGSLSVTTPDLVAPSSPASLAATAYAAPRRVALAWTPSTDNVGVTGYRVYREKTLVAIAKSRSYVDYTVSRGVTYTYAVSAFDAAGNIGAARSVTVIAR
jgi:chitodextrinase